MGKFRSFLQVDKKEQDGRGLRRMSHYTPIPFSFCHTLFSGLTGLLLGALIFAQSPAIAADSEGEDFDLVERDLQFCVVSFPLNVVVGATIPVTVTLSEDLLEEDALLAIDLHGFRGEERVPGLWHSSKIPIVAGDADAHAFEVPIPAGKDINRVAFVVYVLPIGQSDFKDRLHGGETSAEVSEE
jgi:hypothetical protein